ncbi:MAG: regulatory iron-sulfur-containing complex subunit RicT [Bacteroides sp.]|nr:regulatory iron-sulfur-containing complex subunit RicT [Bacteroides sp.]
MAEYKLYNGGGGLCCKSCGRQDKQLNTYDWLADIPGNAEESEYVEVQFKNTRKGYFRNSNKIPVEKGDIVAVEATPGHDIGVVTLTGRLVPLQMRKANIKSEADIKRIYRKAKPVDMDKYNEAKAREHSTMIRARQIALDLKLNMKIGDVEYQGDGNKAIFYYIADERVDFRQLIKVLAEAFRVRIEMKQIGARQEAGRIGGIGPCGRELCCATWMTSFVSVSTSAARFQDISLNPQKLAGQCAKLKCCLNYEVDCYVEAQKRLPSKEVELETKDGVFYFFKADILSNQITYSSDKSVPANLVTISGRRAFEVIGLNKRGIKPDSLAEESRHSEPKKPVDLLEQESLTRFDRSRKGKNASGKNANNKEANANKESNAYNRNKKKKKNNNNRPQEGEPIAAAPNTAPNKPQTAKQEQPIQQQGQGNEAGKGQGGDRQGRNNRNKKSRDNRPPKQQQGEKPQQGEKNQQGEKPQQSERSQQSEKPQQNKKAQQGGTAKQGEKPQPENKPKPNDQPAQE